MVFRGSIGEYKKRAAKLGNALIEGDMLDGSGILFNESATFGYNWAKYCPVRYELRNGKVDRSTIVLLDNYGNPLVKKELLRAIDKYTGRLRCHIPATNRIKTYRFLDNVIIEGDRLLGNGSLFDHNISFGYVWAKYCPIRYEVKSGKADITTLVLLDDNGNPLVKEELLMAIDKDTRILRCHIPARNRMKIYHLLDNALIEGDRLNSNGALFDESICFGSGKRWLTNLGKYRLRYEIAKGAIARVWVFNNNGRYYSGRGYGYRAGCSW